MAPPSFVGEGLRSLGWPPTHSSASPSGTLALQGTTMAGFGNLCVFKADLDIGEFLPWFLQTGNMSPRKRVLSPPPNFPSGLVPKPCGSRKRCVTTLHTLSFSLASAPHRDLHHLRPKAASTDQNDEDGGGCCYLWLYHL